MKDLIFIEKIKILENVDAFVLLQIRRNKTAKTKPKQMGFRVEITSLSISISCSPSSPISTHFPPP